jgi:hypothetical protein|tara:strand:- start:1928 stop:2416 length:489 start_codon:yes stop_codon:yes gene_type:complete
MINTQNTWVDNKGTQYSESDLAKTLMSKILNDGQKIFVGTDSHKSKKSKYIAITTSICSWNNEFSKGGWYCFNRKALPKKQFDTLYSRLFHEAQLSIETACFLRDTLNLEIEEVHIDVNPNESHASNKYATMLKSYVESYGFTCIMKPGSWAASSVADKHAR